MGAANLLKIQDILTFISLQEVLATSLHEKECLFNNVPHLFYSNPITQKPNFEIIGARGCVIDISQHKAMALKLENQNQLLKTFSRSLAHDLKSPMATIKLSLNLLKQKHAFNQESIEYFNIINRTLTQSETMINNLLDYAALESSINTFEKIDLNKEVALVLEGLTAQKTECKAQIQVGNLPQIIGKKEWIKRVFQNLIENALKFSSKSPSPFISIEVEELEKEFVFKIKDNGIGIDLKDQKRIFEICNKLHSSKVYAGSGFGLALCKKIIELHSGKIWVSSALHQGSTFYFSLPKNYKKE